MVGAACDIAMSVRGLSKAYSIAHNQERHITLAETVLAWAKNPLRRAERETFWALKDVSFDVKKGDVVGIIGRNGAGKSTLLKVLSRITEPTVGEIDLYGRVGSLLEVGTGFHPELTGRENIYLNGAILGMRRKEIDREFDAIVDFAGIEQFLDTPVKRYSSGMYVRLAFAVAAHLDPEILIIDEVLAVGDLEFQNKCLGKMKDVATSGRTVLFVSHNMAAVNNLCSTAMLLDKGRIIAHGQTQEVIAAHMTRSHDASDKDDLTSFRPSWAKSRITSARLLSPAGNEETRFPMGSDLVFEMTFRCEDDAEPLRNPLIGVVINHATLGTAGGVNNRMTGCEIPSGDYRQGLLRCTVRRPPLLQGRYTVDVWLGDGALAVDCLNGYLSFDLEPADVYGSGRVPYDNMGLIFFESDFEFEPAAQVAAPVLCAK